MPPPGVPGPFSLADANELEKILVAAGLTRVEIGELPTPYHAASAEEWWTRTAALAGPLARRLAALPEPAVQAILIRARVAISKFERPSGLEIPGLSLVAGGVRA
jgi:hypothetical protein